MLGGTPRIFGGNTGIGSNPTLTAVLSVGNAMNGNSFQVSNLGDTIFTDPDGNPIMILNSLDQFQFPNLGGSGDGFVAVDDFGNLSWSAGSGMAIGSPVVGGTPTLVPYIDASGNLGQNSLFNFDPIGGTYNVVAGGSAFSQDGTTGTTTILSYGIEQISVSDDTGIQQIGDLGGDWAFDLLNINGPNRLITLQDSGVPYLSLDILNQLYQLGATMGAGNGTVLAVNDLLETYVLNKLGGSGSGFVAVDNTGTLSFSAGSGANPPGGTIYNIQVNDGLGGFGGNPNFIYDSFTPTIEATSGGDPYFTANAGSGIFGLGWYAGGGNHTGLVFDDGAETLDVYATNGTDFHGHNITEIGNIANFALLQFKTVSSVGGPSNGTMYYNGETFETYSNGVLNTVPQTISSNYLLAQTGTVNLDSGTTPLTGQYSVGGWINVLTSTFGIFAMTITYTDPNGTVQTAVPIKEAGGGTSFSGVGSYPLSTMNIAMKVGTTWSIDVTITGTGSVVFDAGENLTLLVKP